MFERFALILICQIVVLSSGAVLAQGNVIPSDNASHCPADLTECISELKATLPNTVLEQLRSGPKEITNDFSLTLGLWICNNWIRGKWHSDSPLARYFKKLGIDNAEDMSSIVLTSLWRDLHSQPLRLDEQVHEYQTYWFYNAAQVSENRSIPKSVWNKALLTHTGQRIKLADFKGRAIILLIFSHDIESPLAISSLNSLRAVFSKADLQIVGLLPAVYAMDKADQATFVSENRPLFPLLFEDPSGFSRELRTALISPGDMQVPEIILIGRDGKMITRFNGWDPKTSPEQLRKSIRAAVKK